MLDNVATALAVLALAANALVLSALGGFLLSRTSAPMRDNWERARDVLAPYALPGALVVAVIATGGSLWFQFGALLTPCDLCWFQRICMYPQSLLLGIAVARRDLYTARRYMAPLAACGALISVYHYQLERFPSQPAPNCGTSGPVCSVAYFNIFNFISISYMAGSAFLLIVTLLLMAREPQGEWDEEEAPATSRAEDWVGAQVRSAQR
jgi:disulfide bond formation protein DsbB